MAKLPRSLRKGANGVVVLDVDGVIADSVAENFPHAINAFRKLGGNAIPTAEIEAKFKQARPLIGSNPGNYFVVLKIIQETGNKVDFSKMPQQKFDVIAASFKPQTEQFRTEYIASRKEMMAKDMTAWVKSNKPMPGAIDAVRRIMRNYNTFISTGRDKKSTIELLAAYGLKVPSEKIFSKDDLGGSKVNHMKRISELTGVPLSRILLVDDALAEVAKARTAGAKGLFARAGYTMASHLKEAKRNKVPGIGTLKRKKTQKLIVRKIGKVLRR